MLYRAEPDLGLSEGKWPPVASVLFVAATSLTLWLAIVLTLRAIF